jgi:hypothetical protein
MIYSTTHWHALVNGYTAYPPVWGELAKSLARRLPDADALQTLVDLVPLDLVIAHRALLSTAERRAWDEGAAASGLIEHARFGGDDGDVVYRVALAPKANWRDAVNASPSGTTLAGTPTAPLFDSCRRARIAARFPDEMRASLGVKAVPTEVENAGECTWPALAVRPEGLVVVTATWLDAPPESVPPRVRSRLPHDLEAGRSAATDALVLTPRVPGTYRLRIAVGQEGESEAFSSTEGVVRVVLPPVPSSAPAPPAASGRTE